MTPLRQFLWKQWPLYIVSVTFAVLHGLGNLIHVTRQLSSQQPLSVFFNKTCLSEQDIFKVWCSGILGFSFFIWPFPCPISSPVLFLIYFSRPDPPTSAHLSWSPFFPSGCDLQGGFLIYFRATPSISHHHHHVHWIKLVSQDLIASLEIGDNNRINPTGIRWNEPSGCKSP